MQGDAEPIKHYNCLVWPDLSIDDCQSSIGLGEDVFHPVLQNCVLSESRVIFDFVGIVIDGVGFKATDARDSGRLKGAAQRRFTSARGACEDKNGGRYDEAAGACQQL